MEMVDIEVEEDTKNILPNLELRIFVSKKYLFILINQMKKWINLTNSIAMNSLPFGFLRCSPKSSGIPKYTNFTLKFIEKITF